MKKACDWHCRFVHLGVPALLSVVTFIASVHQVYIFKVNDYDYGIFTNLLWNFANGNGWTMSLYAGQARVNFLADHMALLVPLLAPAFKLFPSPYTLSILHGLSFSAVYFLVPVFVRQIWKEAGRDDYLNSALFLLAALYLSRAFAAAWSYQAHMTTLVLPFLLAALLFLHRGTLMAVIVCCVLVALAQERAVVAVTGVGIYAFLVTGQRRLGFFLCLVSTLYFLLIVKVIIPRLNEAYQYSSAINPLYEVQKKGLFLLKFVVMWFALPVAGKKAAFSALCALPVLALGLVSSRDTMFHFSHHYQDMPSVFFFVSATHGLLWLQGKEWFSRLPGISLAVLSLLLLFVSFRDSRSWLPVRALAKLRPTQEIVRLNHEMETLKSVPASISIYAASGVGPRVSLREKRYEISPTRAGEYFEKSIVVISPVLNAWPYSHGDITNELDANPSLLLVSKTEELLIYASHDVEVAALFEEQ